MHGIYKYYYFFYILYSSIILYEFIDLTHSYTILYNHNPQIKFLTV